MHLVLLAFEVGLIVAAGVAVVVDFTGPYHAEGSLPPPHDDHHPPNP